MFNGSAPEKSQSKEGRRGGDYIKKKNLKALEFGTCLLGTKLGHKNLTNPSGVSATKGA